MKLLKKIALCGIVTALALATIGCTTPESTQAVDQSEVEETQTVSVEGLTASESLEIVIGDELVNIEAVVEPAEADAKLIYKSSNVMVATVDQDGFVKAVSVGECVIVTTVKSGDETFTSQTNVVVTQAETEEAVAEGE